MASGQGLHFAEPGFGRRGNSGVFKETWGDMAGFKHYSEWKEMWETWLDSSCSFVQVLRGAHQLVQNPGLTASRPWWPKHMFDFDISIYLSICLSIYPIYLSIYMYVHLYMYIYTRYGWDRSCRRVQFFWFPISWVKYCFCPLKVPNSYLMWFY